MKTYKIGGLFSVIVLLWAMVVPRAAGGEPMEPASDVLRIAVVQQNGNFGQVAANRAKALDYAAQALAMRADVILFHEELLVGYVENAHELAEPVDGPTTQAFEKSLKSSNSLIVYGLTERDGDKYYIAAVVVSKDGVVAHYRKTHLYPGIALRDERAFYTPGDKLVTFDAKGFKCGLMLCFDGDFPEVTRTYANDACSVLFWMNNRPSRGYAEVGNLAHGNSMIIAASCCTGTDELGHSCAGGSNITGHNGELIAEIWNKEGIIVGDVHPNQALQIRRANPFYICKRPELYH